MGWKLASFGSNPKAPAPGHFVQNAELTNGRRGDETLRTASNEIAVPVVDSEGGEHFIVLTIKIPTGSRDGEAYDGYAAAEDYTMRCNAKAAKQAEKERKAAERKSKGSK